MNSLYEAHGTLSDPYSKLIESFVTSQFPGAKVDGKELLEILTKAFVASSQVRFGPAPNPESLVAIRKAIRFHVEQGEPIPVLVPWGGRKARVGYTIDVAELSALKQLTALNQRIKEHYQPGIEVNIRIEDTGAWYLYQKDNSGDTEKYSDSFQKLVRILNLDFIHPIRESSLMPLQKYVLLSEQIKAYMFQYLMESNINGFDKHLSSSYHNLMDLGWKGEIPKEQREYYYSRYKAADPTLTEKQQIEMLAEYFAGSLARYKLHGTAKDDTWRDQFVQVSFVPPVPGAPTSLVERNLYYRTIPEKMSRSHMPPWRSRGFIFINEEGACPKLTSFNDKTELTPHWTTLSRAGEYVDIDTSYRLED